MPQIHTPFMFSSCYPFVQASICQNSSICYVPSTRNLISNFICVMDLAFTDCWRFSPLSQRKRKYPLAMLQSGLLGSERVLHIYPVPFSEPCWKFYACRTWQLNPNGILWRHHNTFLFFRGLPMQAIKRKRRARGIPCLQALPSYLMLFWRHQDMTKSLQLAQPSYRNGVSLVD